MKKFPFSLLYSYWKNSAMVLIALLVGKSVSLIWKLLIAQLGPENLGAVTLALTIFTVLSSFGLLGLQTALIRFVSIGAKQVLFLSLGISIVISTIVISIISLFPSLLPLFIHQSSTAVSFAQTYIWIVPIFTLSELLWAYLAATQKTTQYALFKYVLAPATRLLMFVLLPTLLVGHIAFSAVFVFVATLLYMRKTLTWPKIDRKLTTQFLTFSLPMSGSFLLFVLYGSLDVLLVGRFLGTATVGLLTAIMLLSDIPEILFSPMLNIFQAHLSKTYKDIKNGLAFTIATIIGFLVVGASIALIVFLFRDPIVAFILGESYTNITGFIGIFLLIKLIDTAITMPIRHYLDFYGHVRLTLLLMGIATVVKIITGVTLIPTFGLWGVAVANAAAVFIHITLCVFALVKYRK